MKQSSRIVLDEEIREVVDAIQLKTRATSPSAAIALLVSRYGRHMLETWEVESSRCPDPTPMSFQGAASTALPDDFSFSEPISL